MKKDICKSCGKPIEFTGKYWEHIGLTPRHPAIPFSEKLMPTIKTCVNCAKEPNWENTKEGEVCFTIDGEDEWVYINNPYMFHTSCPEWEKKQPVIKDCLTCGLLENARCLGVPKFMWVWIRVDENDKPFSTHEFDKCEVEDCFLWKPKGE